jgi:hypothetical protein
MRAIPIAADCARRKMGIAREDARSTHLVCIKQPDGGCVLAHRDRLTIVPALRCKRVDEGGAGGANLHEQAGRAGVLPWPHRYRCTASSAARMRERTAAGLTGSDATTLARRSAT